LQDQTPNGSAALATPVVVSAAPATPVATPPIKFTGEIFYFSVNLFDWVISVRFCKNIFGFHQQSEDDFDKKNWKIVN
jgi:hypothetical protein